MAEEPEIKLPTLDHRKGREFQKNIYWNQAGIKIAERNINNLRYADDTILMAESEEELNSLLMRVKKLA